MPSNFQYEAYLLIHDILLGLTYCILRKFQPFKVKLRRLDGFNYLKMIFSNITEHTQ